MGLARSSSVATGGSMASYIPCGCSRKSDWYYRGEWHRLPAPVCGDCGIEVNGCRKCGAFFSIKEWKYVCDDCLVERRENMPFVCPICGGVDEHINGSLFCAFGTPE